MPDDDVDVGGAFAAGCAMILAFVGILAIFIPAVVLLWRLAFGP